MGRSSPSLGAIDCRANCVDVIHHTKKVTGRLSAVSQRRDEEEKAEDIQLIPALDLYVDIWC